MKIQPSSFYLLFISFLLLVFASNTVFTQIKLGDNRTIIQPGSLMKLESTNRGLPNIRLNTSQATYWLTVFNADDSRESLKLIKY